jgi:hypothetical protein
MWNWGTFRSGREYLKGEINELETGSENSNIWELLRDIIEFKEGYLSRNYLVKDEKGDLVAYFYSIVNRWKNHFCQLS